MVNTKMTAIADKIRSLLGITGKMGLDAMAANLETEQTNLAAAFASVEAKGGTVPESKVSGNLAAAIDGIPDGVSVQRKSGSFTVNSSGGATVNCGFKPDMVAVNLGEANGAKVTATAPFCEISADDVEENGSYESVVWTDDNILILTTLSQTSTGFSVYMRAYDFSQNGDSLPTRTYNYVAVKYT